MSLITKMRRQDAIYWPPAAPDSFGRPGIGPLVELTAATGFGVRWEENTKEFLDARDFASSSTGTTKMSDAVVYVPQLPDGSEVVVGGYLWLGKRADLVSETNPVANRASEIQRFDRLPNLKASEMLRTCYL